MLHVLSIWEWYNSMSTNHCFLDLLKDLLEHVLVPVPSCLNYLLFRCLALILLFIVLKNNRNQTNRLCVFAFLATTRSPLLQVGYYHQPERQLRPTVADCERCKNSIFPVSPVSWAAPGLQHSTWGAPTPRRSTFHQRSLRGPFHPAGSYFWTSTGWTGEHTILRRSPATQLFLPQTRTVCSWQIGWIHQWPWQ